eukprot:1160033-Pelagomonas_calceolata.AAC.9
MMRPDYKHSRASKHENREHQHTCSFNTSRVCSFWSSSASFPSKINWFSAITARACVKSGGSTQWSSRCWRERGLSDLAFAKNVLLNAQCMHVHMKNDAWKVGRCRLKLACPSTAASSVSNLLLCNSTIAQTITPT